MSDFLLELRSEEIPARMQAKARDDLARLFAAELAKAGLRAGETIAYSTPRRLALIARDLPETTPAVREELKGPRASAPPQALDGFLRKTGLAREALVERDGVLFAVIDRPGRATIHVLAEAIPAIVRGFPWPKAMRWGAASISTESPRWVRPLHGIVALLGDEIVPVEIAGIASSAATLGHRFHHPGAITIGSAADYVEKLRACHVIVDQAEREALIRARAAALAAEAGLALIEDEGLVVENAGLTEWPAPLLGRFDADFLSVPPEVIQLTARVNQKYFVCRAADGALANAFICTANIDASDGGAAIVEGNRKVLAARLADARFFYEADIKVPLEEQAKKLDRIVFHEKLGTVADKVERVAKLARWLVEEGIVGVQSSPVRGGGAREARDGGVSPLVGGGHPSITGFAGGPPPLTGEDLAALAERAARLCKADLVTGMVGEFPELQGVMGGYYAAAQGEPRVVSDAIRDHYKPVGQGDEVPTAPVTVAVSLADKLDTLYGYYCLGQFPTGSKDPFALRRAVQASINLIAANSLRVNLGPLIWRWLFIALDMPISLNFQTPIAFRTVFQNTFFIEMMGGSSSVVIPAAGVVSPDLLPNHLIRTMSQFCEKLAERAEHLVGSFVERFRFDVKQSGGNNSLIAAVTAVDAEDDVELLRTRVNALARFLRGTDGPNLLSGYRRANNLLTQAGYYDRHYVGPWMVPLRRRVMGASAADIRADAERKRPSPKVGDALSYTAQPQENAASTSVTPAQAGVAAGEGGRADHATPAFAGVTNGAEEAEGAHKPLSYTPLPEEYALIAALESAEPRARAAVAAEAFEAAMTALASLRAPIDAFFEHVTVNDPDPAKRAARLALLARVRDAVHQVADFSRIEG